MNLNPAQFIQQIRRKNKRFIEFLEDKAPRIVGVEAVNFFKRSFDKGGFTDKSLIKWKPAKRTNKSSKWYGFEYRARTPIPSNHARRSGTKRPYKARKENPITNFSPAATKRKTLNGATGDLKESISYKKTGAGQIVVSSNLDYANVHNNGGMIKIFGKKSVKLPKRQFIGESKTLNEIIRNELKTDIIKLLND